MSGTNRSFGSAFLESVQTPEILSLPLYYAMSDQDVEDVIEAVRRICAYYAK